jgi:hypothetical protein
VRITDADSTGFVGEHKQCSDEGRAEEGKLGCGNCSNFHVSQVIKASTVPIEELLCNDSLSSNRTVVYAYKGFHHLHAFNRTNRKVFRLILCAPVKTIANKHERWMLRAIEGVGISDKFRCAFGFCPKPGAKWRHMPSVPEVTPSNIAVMRLS